MNHPAHVPVALLVALVSIAPAYAGPGHPGFTRLFPAGLNNTVSDLSDDVDQPSALVATGDFNRDGIADMVEITPADSKGSDQHFLTVMLGQADGTFKGPISHGLVGNQPRALVVGDFNQDGNPDVIVGDGDGQLLEFVGNGKGDLAGAGKIATVGSVVSAAIGHFTHDGNLDLVVSDFQSNSAAIFLGAGDGSFRLTWSFPLPKRGTPFRVAAADFNRDGITDLVITNADDDNYEVMLGNGNGTFSYAPELSHVRDPNSYCPS